MNNVIIVGPDHYNTLGIVRSLGEKGIKSIVIIFTEGGESSFVLKSKYLKAGYLYKNADDSIIDFIVDKWYSKEHPSIVIGSSDIACTLIDANLSKLDGFICANCNKQENGVVRLMDKFTMNLNAARSGIEVPQSFLLRKDDNLNIDEVRLPCIVKPLESSFGNKSDIAICNTKEDLLTAYSVFESQHIDILIQDFIKAEYEIGIMGCSFYNSGEVWIPDVIFKKRYSNKSAVFAEVEPIQNHSEYVDIVNKIKNLISMIGYRGVFDVDLLCAGGHIYFIEMNMRNGAYGYGLSNSGTNFVYSWVMEATGKSVSLNPLTHSTKIMCEFSDFKKRKENGVSLNQWLRDYRNSSHMIMQCADYKPAIAYITGKILQK